MKKFTFEDLLQIYQKYERKYPHHVHQYISEILNDAKPAHKACFSGNDHEQSWRSFKGKNFEKLIIYILKNEIHKLGLKITDGNHLERSHEQNLSPELAMVKRNLLIDYGEFGYHLPDVDIIIYEPPTYRIIALLSSKVTLRERIAQSSYWKLKLLSQDLTKHIKVYFVTPDEDGTLTTRNPAKKGRAIVEIDLDGSYVLGDKEIIESDKVKKFDKIIPDIEKLLKR